MKKILATLGILGVTTIGAADASVLNETPIQRVEVIKGERVEARQIGNVVETTLPWKDQAGIKVKYDMGEPTIEEKLKDKRDKQVITEVVGTDGFKVDIILDKKPNTNVFCYAIENAEDYDFFYQPPLTQEEIDEGAERPDNVVGSYAVFHKTLKNHKLGEENYETGKVMHIYRPQVWEVNNPDTTKQWAELSYNDRGLCVTAPQDFLDSAKYPVRIDPTFGYTTIGGSSVSIFSSSNYGSAYSLGESGDVSKVTIYNDDPSGTSNQKSFIQDSGESSIVSTIGGPVNVNSTAAWRDYTLTASLTAGTYNLTFVQDNTMRAYYDVGTTGQALTKFIASSYTTPVPTSGSSKNDRAYSIYATYTAGGGGNTRPTITSISDTPDPQTVGSDITFSVDWNDADGEGVTTYICDTAATSTSGCASTTYCSHTATSTASDPQTCTYTTQNADIAASPITYYAFVCDDEGDSTACSNATSSTFSVQAVPETVKTIRASFSGDTTISGDVVLE